MTDCPHCAAAESNPMHTGRDRACLGCDAHHIAEAAQDWKPPKHAPGRTRWHAVRDLMAVMWRDEQRRQQGRPLVWRWVLRLKRAEVAQ